MSTLAKQIAEAEKKTAELKALAELYEKLNKSLKGSPYKSVEAFMGAYSAANGVASKPAKTAKKAPASTGGTKKTPEALEELKKLKDAGKTDAEVAAHFKISTASVANWKKSAGLTKSKK